MHNGFMRLVVACAIVLLILNSGDSQTRPRPTTRPPAKRDAGRERSPKAEAPIPGLPNIPRQDVSAERAQLQKQLDERKQRKTAAAREAQRLRERYASALNVGRIVDPSHGVADAAGLLFHAGLLDLEAERWPSAQEAFQTIVTDHAASLWAQEARLCLFDLAFEADLDPSAAASTLSPALAWTHSLTPEPPPSGPQVMTLVDTSGLTGKTLPLQRPGPAFEPPAAGEVLESRSPSAVAADVYLRAGLLRWLAEDAVSTQEHFRQAFRFHPSPQSALSAVASAVIHRTAYSHTPPQVREGETDEIGRLILYADVLQNALQMYRAHQLWSTLLTKRSRDLSSLQRSYIHFRRGHARFQFLNPLERDPDAVLKDYEQSRKLAPAAPWADQSLLMAGNVAWNLKADPAEAIALWQKLLDEYPASAHAPQAAYYIGVTHERNREWEQAYLAFADAQERYPDSSFRDLIEKHLRTVRGRLPRPPPSVEATTVPSRSKRGKGAR